MHGARHNIPGDPCKYAAKLAMPLRTTGGCLLVCVVVLVKLACGGVAASGLKF